MSSEKYFRPLTRNEFETDEVANKEVQDIIVRSEREERERESNENAARIVREYHERERKKEQGLCTILGGKIKKKSTKSKSKRFNKRVKKNKRYSRKSRKTLKK